MVLAVTTGKVVAWAPMADGANRHDVFVGEVAFGLPGNC